MSQKKIPELESYHLGVGSGSHARTHSEETGEMLKRTEEVLLKEASDLVFGEATTTVVTLKNIWDGEQMIKIKKT